MCQWAKGDFAAQPGLGEALLAIVTHNLYPERGVEGVLYTPDKVQDGCPVLRDLLITEDVPLALLLGICDALQEWHRGGFAPPDMFKRRLVNPIEVRARVDFEKDKVIFSLPVGRKRDGKTMAAQKKEDFNLRFGDSWKQFVELRDPDQ